MHYPTRRCPATPRAYLSERPRLDRREVGRSGSTAALVGEKRLLGELPSAVLQFPKGVDLHASSEPRGPTPTALSLAHDCLKAYVCILYASPCAPLLVLWPGEVEGTSVAMAQGKA